MSTAYFNSTKNYLKRDPSSGSDSMLGPNSSLYGGYIFQRTKTVAHNLGYVPFCKVFYEPFGDGTIIPIISLPLQQLANNIVGSGSSTGPGLLYWADTTNLYIRLYYEDATLANNTYPIHWVVYKDFQLA